MATNSVFNFLSTKYQDLATQVMNWLKVSQNKSDINFSNASPYGQIITANEELYSHSILYAKNAVQQWSIDTSTDDRVIGNESRISGNNPTRPISATGTLKLKLKNGTNISDEIAGSKIKIYDKTSIKNKSLIKSKYK